MKNTLPTTIRFSTRLVKEGILLNCRETGDCSGLFGNCREVREYSGEYSGGIYNVGRMCDNMGGDGRRGDTLTDKGIQNKHSIYVKNEKMCGKSGVHIENP